MANANLQAQIAAMQKKFEEKKNGVHGDLYKAVTKACLIVEAEAKREMTETEIDFSKTYGKRQHHPSVEWDAPAVDFGMLRRSVTHSVEQNGANAVGRVGSTITNPPYGAYLEYGTSKMAPRPWLKPAIAASREKIHKLLSEAVAGRKSGIGVEGAIASVEATDAAG